MNEFADVAERLRAAGSKWGAVVHHALETGSTNDDARAAAKEGAPSGAVWIAEHQTKGRGRQGRQWLSSVGENLLFSVLLRPGFEARDMPPVTLAVGIGVLRALVQASGRDDLAIKWPNDIVMRDDLRKVAGILVESTVTGGVLEALVIGVGINVNQLDFQETIRSGATSMAAVVGRGFDRSHVLVSVLAQVEACVDEVLRSGFSALHEELEHADALRHRTVTAGGVTGIARGISVDGSLLLEAASGRVEIGSGEVDVL